MGRFLTGLIFILILALTGLYTLKTRDPITSYYFGKQVTVKDKVGEFYLVDIFNKPGGHWVIGTVQNGKWQEIEVGNGLPKCDVMHQNNVPRGLYINCIPDPTAKTISEDLFVASYPANFSWTKDDWGYTFTEDKFLLYKDSHIPGVFIKIYLNKVLDKTGSFETETNSQVAKHTVIVKNGNSFDIFMTTTGQSTDSDKTSEAYNVILDTIVVM